MREYEPAEVLGFRALLLWVYLVYTCFTLAASAAPIVVLTDANECVGMDSSEDFAVVLLLVAVFFILMAGTWLVIRKLRTGLDHATQPMHEPLPPGGKDETLPDSTSSEI
jgi:hypothetical protein